ncbi:MAG: hypothetical protein NTX45_15265 [Proteobacteria bacterium]|nr:hypothetical protein [Pseudomonadota bacterium]
MNKRTEYQREYMKGYRAKQRETRATALQANPLADIGKAGFTVRQLGQLQEIVRGELETLLTPLTANNVNTVSKPVNKLTAANVNTGNKLCPQCGGAVIGQSTKVYCSDPCRKKAFRQRAKT